jgi:phytanoyl-CoA hydroxylase
MDADDDPIAAQPWVLVPRALAQREQFEDDGFVVSRGPVLSSAAVDSCRQHLDDVLVGKYDRGVPPTKAPKYDWHKLDRNDKRRRATLQIINIRHCDSAFARVVHSPELGELVAALAGWTGARVAQDQVWAKPPGAVALTFHRDTPYFAFVPERVVTVWITFDDLAGPDATRLGPLEYYPGSHRWESHQGIATQFFDKDHRNHLKSAAEREAGVTYDESRIVRVVTPAGGLSVHDGKTWHGSANNETTQFRRGIGIHFVRPDVVFRDGWIPPQWESIRAKHNLALAAAAADAADEIASSAKQLNGGQTKRARNEGAADAPSPVDDPAPTGVSQVTAPVDNTVPDWECPVTWREPEAGQQ